MKNIIKKNENQTKMYSVQWYTAVYMYVFMCQNEKKEKYCSGLLLIIYIIIIFIVAS